MYHGALSDCVYVSQWLCPWLDFGLFSHLTWHGFLLSWSFLWQSCHHFHLCHLFLLQYVGHQNIQKPSEGQHSLPNSEFPQLERGISDLLLSTLTTPAGTLLLYLAQKYLKTRLLLAHSQNECTVYIHTYISMVTWRLCIGLYAYDLIITVFHMKLSLNRCWVKRKGVCVCVRLFMHVCTEGPMPFRIRNVSNRNVECNVVTWVTRIFIIFIIIGDYIDRCALWDYRTNLILFLCWIQKLVQGLYIVMSLFNILAVNKHRNIIGSNCVLVIG